MGRICKTSAAGKAYLVTFLQDLKTLPVNIYMLYCSRESFSFYPTQEVGMYGWNLAGLIGWFLQHYLKKLKSFELISMYKDEQPAVEFT